MRMLLIFFALWLATSSVSAANLQVWLERDRISLGETVQLTVEAEGQSGDLDTGPLAKDFDILNTGRSSQYSLINGKASSTTRFTLILSPKREGRLTVPALAVNGQTSQPLSLEVGPAGQVAADASGNPGILLETELEPAESYVQAQAIYKVRVLYAVQLQSGQLSEPRVGDALLRKLGEDRKYTTMRKGKRYQVIEQRYAIFPQSSGRLEIGAPILDAEVAVRDRTRRDDMFGRSLFSDLMTRTQRLRVPGQPRQLEVKPRPTELSAPHWLPASEFELDADWGGERDSVPFGEPITLNLTLRAKGLLGTQLPELQWPQDDFNVYPDQAETETQDLGDGVLGLRREKIAFIPKRAGELRLPTVRLAWWDVEANQQRVIEVPGPSIRVLPAPKQQGENSQPPRSDVPLPQPRLETPAARPVERVIEADAGIWPWLTAGATLAWLLTLALWWRSARQPSTTPTGGEAPSPRLDGSKARRRFRQACQSGDAATARDQLLAWAQSHWPNDPPRGLAGLAARLHDPGTRDLLMELDRQLYRDGPNNWDGRRLAAELNELPRESRAKPDGNLLPELYPAK